MLKKFLSRFRSRPSPEAADPPPKQQPEQRAVPSDVKPQREGRRGPRPPATPQPAASAPPAAAAQDRPPRRRRRRKPAGPEAESTSAAPARREAVTGRQPRDLPFGSVHVSAPVAKALGDMGYEAPTPIQELVVAPMLEGLDLVGQAQTGTGKTAGFGIPLAEVVDGAELYVQAIALVPTRELARQVAGEVTCIVKYRGIRVAAVYGGAPMGRQIADLDAGAQIVVGTPGRVIDLLDRGVLKIDRVRTVILDEADQMLDIGFLPDIRRILRSTPRSRQTALFTATVPTQIRRLIYSYLNEPQWFLVGEESTPVESIRQMYCEVARRDKLDALLEILRNEDGEQTLLFRRTQEDVNWLVRMLKQKGIAVDAIHGGLRQSERNAVMQAFRDGRVKLLVSTSLTSRGIDVPAVGHVINYDIPEQVEEYIHRIGRTARMGRPGTAITFVSEWDIEFFDAIRDHVGADKLEEIDLTLYSSQQATGTG